jgi:hypothetical protein
LSTRTSIPSSGGGWGPPWMTSLLLFDSILENEDMQVHNYEQIGPVKTRRAKEEEESGRVMTLFPLVLMWRERRVR